MGEKTGIAWTDHTFNPWIGCQKVSEGCENCYAERQNKSPRGHWVAEWGKDYRLTSEANWREPIKWARQAKNAGVTRRVFCASLADVFDVNVSPVWRYDLWSLISDCNNIGGLEWLLLTKRPNNIVEMIPARWLITPPPFVRIGTTIENQEMADKRKSQLLNAWPGKNFFSVEPMLGSVWLGAGQCEVCGGSGEVSGNYFADDGMDVCEQCGGSGETDNRIDWVICGSESGPKARQFNIDWARNLRDQCKNEKIPFFLKQMPINGKLTVLPELDGRIWAQFPGEITAKDIL